MSEDKKSKCEICHNSFPEHELTGTQVGIWFVICCEPCRKENEKPKDTTQPECVIEIIDPEQPVSEVVRTGEASPISRNSDLQGCQGVLF